MFARKILRSSNPGPKFDSKAFRNEALALNPSESADLATKWAERAVNAEMSYENTMDTVGKLGSGGLFALAIGAHMGRQKAQSEQLIAEWEAGGAAEAEYDLEEYPTPWSAGEMRDPSKIWFIPWTWFWTGIVALWGAVDWKGAPYVREAAKAGFFVILAGLGERGGYNMRQKRLEAAAKEEEAAEAAA